MTISRITNATLQVTSNADDLGSVAEGLVDIIGTESVFGVALENYANQVAATRLFVLLAGKAFPNPSIPDEPQGLIALTAHRIADVANLTISVILSVQWLKDVTDMEFIANILPSSSYLEAVAARMGEWNLDKIFNNPDIFPPLLLVLHGSKIIEDAAELAEKGMDAQKLIDISTNTLKVGVQVCAMTGTTIPALAAVAGAMSIISVFYKNYSSIQDDSVKSIQEFFESSLALGLSYKLISLIAPKDSTISIVVTGSGSLFSASLALPHVIKKAVKTYNKDNSWSLRNNPWKGLDATSRILDIAGKSILTIKFLACVDALPYAVVVLPMAKQISTAATLASATASSLYFVCKMYHDDTLKKKEWCKLTSSVLKIPAVLTGDSRAALISATAGFAKYFV